MIFRKAEVGDIPAIIELLKLSLGESLIPKSEALWIWKHVDNPFGPSPVLVAEAEGRLIGVRAFMRWKYKDQERNFSALRAVDTATHPHWQGKGIFSKLTGKLVEECKKDGDDFIFNTPNEKSLRGYLKLGWKEKGPLPLKILIRRPFSMLKKAINRPKTQENFTLDYNWNRLPHFENHVASQAKTEISSHYLNWRYRDCPLFNYGFRTDQESYLIIYRIKPHSYGNELRLVELIPFHKNKKLNYGHLYKNIDILNQTYETDFTSCSSSVDISMKNLLWTPSLKIGPMVTLKDLNLNGQYSDFLTGKKIGFSIGDLELF